LYGNFNGTWEFNQTIANPSEGITTGFTLLNLSEGNFLWNVNCSDNFGTIGWGLTNQTFGVDMTNPNISIGTITTPTGLQTVIVYFNVSDLNLDKCNYTVLNNLGVYDTSGDIVLCSSPVSVTTTLAPGNTFNITLNAFDKAGNTNHSSKIFSTIPVSPGGGGGGGETGLMVKAVVLIRPVGEALYSNLDRAKIYTGLYKFCINNTVYGKCSQTEDSLDKLIVVLNNNYKIVLTPEKLKLWINQYDLRRVENAEISKKDADTWKLIVAEIVISPIKFYVTPSKVDALKLVLGGDVVSIQVLSNKELQSCQKVSGDVGFSCSVSGTTAEVKYKIPSGWDFGANVVNAQISYTDTEQETIYQDVQFRIFGRGIIISSVVLVALLITFGFLFKRGFKGKTRIRKEKRVKKVKEKKELKPMFPVLTEKIQNGFEQKA
jgi:hypothetical protein